MCNGCQKIGQFSLSYTAALSLAPRLTVSPQDMDATRTETVTFTCMAVAVPAANITWEKDNSSISSGGRYNISTVTGAMLDDGLLASSMLTISNVQKEDEGSYQCTASNTEGSAMGTATLTVQGKEKIKYTTYRFYSLLK